MIVIIQRQQEVTTRDSDTQLCWVDEPEFYSSVEEALEDMNYFIDATGRTACYLNLPHRLRIEHDVKYVDVSRREEIRVAWSTRGR